VEFLFVDDYISNIALPTEENTNVTIPTQEKKRNDFHTILDTHFKHVIKIEREENDYEPVLDNPGVHLRILILEVELVIGDITVKHKDQLKKYFTISYPFITIILNPNNLKFDIDFLDIHPKDVVKGNYYSHQIYYPNGKSLTMNLDENNYNYVFEILQDTITDIDNSSIYNQDEINEARKVMDYKESHEIELNELNNRFRIYFQKHHPQLQNNLQKNIKDIVSAYRVLASTLKNK
jgi:hypothetical protein